MGVNGQSSVRAPSVLNFCSVVAFLIISVNPAEGTTAAGACTGCHWNLLPPPLHRCCCLAIDEGRSCCCVATHSLSTGNRDSKQGSQQQQQQLAPLGVEWQLQLLLADWIGLFGLIPSPSATPAAAVYWRCLQGTTTPFLVPSFVTRPWRPICCCCEPRTGVRSPGSDFTTTFHLPPPPLLGASYSSTCFCPRDGHW